MKRRSTGTLRVLSGVALAPAGILIFIAGAVLLAGCGAGQGPVDELERNRRRWEEIRPQRYVYAIEVSCFCPPDTRQAVRVTVDADTVEGRVYVSGGDVPEVNAELFPAVDGLFDLLQAAYDDDAFEVRVTYDPETGVPIDIFIDRDRLAADEELGVRVTEPVTELDGV